jgi:hypothetical protein
MKSRTGAVFTMGKGAIISDSLKQKVNSQSSTESEIVGVDDKIHKVAWAKRFAEHQGFKVKLNIVYQDNTSSMKFLPTLKPSVGTFPCQHLQQQNLLLQPPQTWWHVPGSHWQLLRSRR